MNRRRRDNDNSFLMLIIRIIVLFVCAMVLVFFVLHRFKPNVYYFIMSDTLHIVSTPVDKQQETYPFSPKSRNKEKDDQYIMRDKLMKQTIEEKIKEKEQRKQEQETSQNELPISFNFAKIDDSNKNAMLAIIVDDGGYRLDLAKRVAELDIPLTWAIMPYERHTREFADIASEHNVPYIIHFPMQAEIDKIPGVNAIGKGMSSADIRIEIAKAFSILPDAVGLNNHRGSLATSDKKIIQPVIDEIKIRNKIFVDSRTSAKSVGYDIAKEAKIRTFINRGFLDNRSDEKYIELEFKKVVNKALKNGNAVVICHFRPETITFLEKLNEIRETIPVKLVTIPQMAEMMYEKQTVVD